MRIQNIFLGVLLAFAACNTKSSSIATSWELPSFIKVDTANPILFPDTNYQFLCPVAQKSVQWQAKNVLNPTAFIKEGKVYLLYRAQDSLMTSRLGLAVSEDGIHFQKQPHPIFYPAPDDFYIYEKNGGVEDPRVVMTPDSSYFLTYTAYDGKTARLCFAISKNLVDWQKFGPVLKSPKYIDQWSKSGALVVEKIGDQMVAKKLNGKFWMYFGDTDLFMASSSDLLHWEALENEESKKLVSVLSPRAGYFDSRLVEPGPFALYTEKGIVLIYNSSNAANNADSNLPKFTYAASQALFDKVHPYKLIDRMKNYFLFPDKEYEKIGEVNNVCFVEGLVSFKKQWILYYGTADSKIAVAIANQ